MNHPISQRLSVIASAISSSVQDAPRQARLAGFRGLLFDVWSSDLSLPDLSNSGRREFRQIIAAQDQQLVGLRMDLGNKGLAKDADVDLQLSRLSRAMDAAAGLGSPLLCVDLGPLPTPAIAPKPRPAIPKQEAGLIIIPEPTTPVVVEPQIAPDTEFISHINVVMSQIGALADRYSVMLAFSSSLANVAALSQVLIDANCPWFGVDLDPITILRDSWPADDIFSRLGSQIRHVRARDGVLGSEKRVKAAIIGRGSVDWPLLLSQLDQAGYPGFMTIDSLEMSDRALAATAGAQFLRNIPG